MSVILVLSLQAAAVATPAATAPLPAAAPRWAMAAPGAQPLDFDLARQPSSGAGACLGATGSDVLVCGLRRGRGDYPLERWARIFGPEAPIRTEMRLGRGATGDVHVEQQEYSNGTVAKRLMVRVRTRF